MPPVKFDIVTALLSLLGFGVAWLLKGGVKYLVNNAAKPRITSSVGRANMQDANANVSESLVLAAAQMHQTENADLRKENNALLKDMVKLARELGKAEGKLEAALPTDTQMIPFTDAEFEEEVEIKPEEQFSAGLEMLPKSERKPHILQQEKLDDEISISENFRQNLQAGRTANSTKNSANRER